MPANFIDVESREQLDGLFKSSFERPIAILKHSNTCGISAHIHETLSEIDATINVVVVQSHRALSDEIANLTGHRHQSPQAFIIRDGKAIYHATHYGIDPGKILEAIATA